MKIQISFGVKKKIKYVFNKSINQFYVLKKKSNLYLMKIQISFEFRKNQI